MSLGLGIFASVIVILAVYNLWFRKVMKNVVFSTVAVTMLGGAAIVGYRNYTERKAQQAQAEAQAEAEAQWDARVQACKDRFLAALPPPSGYWSNGYALFDCRSKPDAIPKIWLAPPGVQVCLNRFRKLLPAESGNPNLTAICSSISVDMAKMPKSTAAAHALVEQVQQVRAESDRR